MEEPAWIALSAPSALAGPSTFRRTPSLDARFFFLACFDYTVVIGLRLRGVPKEESTRGS